MFPNPESAELAALRLTMEPVAEIIQHKVPRSAAMTGWPDLAY